METPSASDTINPQVKAEVQRRLRLIEGQIRGVQTMVENDRHCRDVVIQLSAIKASVASLNTLVAETYARQCLCGSEPTDTNEVTRLLDILKAAR
ncbi:metal-sensitive transcriptional regulator [Chloroflexia bacterium SDU3-3]|nr:metal-sensitive transcriptional regulator [Chloroflexia bacterium SDU3-3]